MNAQLHSIKSEFEELILIDSELSKLTAAEDTGAVLRKITNTEYDQILCLRKAAVEYKLERLGVGRIAPDDATEEE